MDAEVVVVRPGFGRALAVVVVVLCTAGAVSGLVADVAATLPWLPVLALAGLGAWAAYWRPAVVVTPAGVELVNVTRTVEVPWTAVEAVETRYALALQTPYGTYAAWAAPAPSAVRTGRARPEDYAHLPSSTYGTGGGVRAGDLAGTDSGAAALVVRRRWEQLVEAGVLDDPRLERPTPVVRWHVGTLVAAGVLLALAVVGLTR
ncbi:MULTISPECIES: PH domain-containing protein [Cellulomonas]|uniref:Low molecular weight protein antigen 6 PH domain-containing protein n=1 Tax=Cellulomonas oligotrophica TaxID=931536 RepID=A0A7Y9FHQ7_9CELL|nr:MULTISPECIES: PH domain-containing protein [Cellulomonas]NYD87534.1 hypothetical protein [Cellulomonas oligotrophica]TQL01349.1 PH (Pleckstrin Homology) domain-containing protein [Cellulomonas sp. SLBN-39]GIG33412.1 hypothetical protein Col01nite_25710 [Cellulomonas oligotrophica]